MEYSEPSGPESKGKGCLFAGIVVLIVLSIAFAAMHFVAVTWGVVYLLLGWIGVGAACGFILGVGSFLDNMNPFVIWQGTRFGMLPGFVVGMFAMMIFSALGYEDDVVKKERLAQEATEALTALESSVRNPANSLELPMGRLPASISSRCSNANSRDKRRTIELLSTLCSDADPRVRGLAVVAISEIEDRSVHAVILARADDEMPFVRASSAVALSKASPFLDDIAAALLALLKDRDADVRLSAAFGVREAMPLLHENWQAIERDLPNLDPGVSAVVVPALRRELELKRREEGLDAAPLQ
jgi:hypothetical protein